MAFDEVQFPTNISRNARGGPRRKTQIAALANGDEERNASWLNSRRAYDVAYGVRNADALATVVAFFEARNGMLYGFRFKDWADYKSSAPSVAVAATNQPIGTGTGAQTTFQLVKNYTSGARTYGRAITKPVAGTVKIALSGVEVFTGWTVNTTTGIVTFTVAPGVAVPVTAGFEFDTPVRFDSDMMDVALDFERLGSISSIPLIEVRK